MKEHISQTIINFALLDHRSGQNMSAEIRAITGLRGIGAFVVFFVHVNLPWPPSRMGQMGVCLFFVLSGFILTYTLKGCTLGHLSCRKGFWWKRFARIFPSHYAALLVAIIQLYCFWESRCSEWAQIPTTLTLIQEWFRPIQGWITSTHWDNWNPPSWTLSEEQAFYLAFPWLIRIPSSFLPYAAAACILPTLIASVADPVNFYDDESNLNWFIRRFVFFRMFEFLLGVLVAKKLMEISPSGEEGVAYYTRFLGLVAAPVLLLIIVFAIPFVDPKGVEIFCSAGATAPLFAMLIAGLAMDKQSKSYATRFVSWSPIYYFGKISFAFYLVHFSFPYYFNGLVDPSVFALVWFCVALSIAISLHLFIEGPSYRWLTKWKSYPCACSKELNIFLV